MFLFSLVLFFIATAMLLAWFLIRHDRGASEPVWALWLALGFGILGVFIASPLEGWLINDRSLMAGAPYGGMLVAALGVGLIEEGVKFLPLALLIYKRRYFNEHSDGVIYFALAGLGFGLPENIIYTLEFGTQAGKLRLLLTPIFHAAGTGIIGYFLIKRKLARINVLTVAIPLLLVAGLHGLYDFGLSTGNRLYLLMAILITLGLSATLFIVYLKATQMDQIKGLSAVGHNKFCRSCGKINPRHHLYCINCGKRA